MKTNLYFYIIILFLFLSTHVVSQTFDGEWSAEYVTSDNPDSTNSTGYNVISVGALAEDSFVALVNRSSAEAYYLVGYKDAGPNSGRLGFYPYSSGIQTKWVNVFDQEFMHEVNDIATKDNLVYVPNNAVNANEEMDNSILIFEVKDDSVYTHPQRFEINSYLWAIDVDDNGRIYVTKTGDGTTPGSVTILENPNTAPAWKSNGSAGTILQEIALPDTGSPRGITVNGDGSVIYVSNHDLNKVYCYVGSPIDGYEIYDGFDFSVDGQFQTTTELSNVGPFGLQLMPTKNLLFVAHDLNYSTGIGYEYARIYIANPNTGEILDTINVAEWNLATHGSYTDRTTGIASGFASTYAVDFDENENIYSQSFYGWTVEKWVYSNVLPTVELTITSVEKLEPQIPNEISLEQNYPNPFNPSTTIQFNLNKQEEVSLSIYDITGSLVTNLISSATYSAGSYKVTFDASNLSSGTYLYSLQIGTNQLTKTMTLLK